MRITLGVKIVGVVLISILVVSVVTGYMSTRRMSEVYDQSISEKLTSDVNMLQALINFRYPGIWTVQDGKLYKGDQLFNEYYELTDMVGEATGALCTVFAGDTRVATNVMAADGKRAIGTKASQAVTSQVLVAGQTYSGVADVLGQAHEAMYIPIKNSEDKAIGMLFIGVSRAEIEIATRSNVISLLFIVGGFSLTALILASVFVRSVTGVLNRSISGLGESSQQIASASQQLSATSQQLAAGSAQQASAIQETSATLEETSSMVLQNSENTRQAATLSSQARIAAEKGNEEMGRMMSSMSELKKSSDQIGKIIKVIDNIAFQTNILALNAAVEAARAGEAGMGFAVVAEEVRNLAQRSAQAASDTAAIIETNIELSQHGVEGTKRVGEALGEIARLSKKVNELVDEVAAATQEQSQGISQINKAISQIEQSTQENAASSQESASASEELNAQAAAMKDIVGDLMRVVNGGNDHNAATTTRDLVRTRVNTVSAYADKAPAPKRVKTKRTTPEDIIPLEDDNQF